MTRRIGLAAAIAAASLVAGVPLLAGTSGSAGAAGVSYGRELVTRPATTQPLSGGGSATAYGVALPTGASCPGDTAHGQYRVYSYLVPSDVDLSSVSFKGDLPSRGYGFIAEGGYYFGAVNTGEGTGLVVGMPPAFTFSRLTPAELFAAPGSATTTVWNGGIACVNTHGVVTDAWNSSFRFVRDAADPAGFRWTVENGAVPTGSPAEGGPWLLIGIVLVAVSAATVGALLLASRRAKRDARGTTPRTGAAGGSTTMEPDVRSGARGHGGPTTHRAADANADLGPDDEEGTPVVVPGATR